MAKTPTIPHTSEDDPVAALVGADGALTAEGERRANVPTDKLREMYRLMVVCRRLDQEGLNLQRQGELGLWGPIAGHEAAQIGAALAMERSDWIFPDRVQVSMTTEFLRSAAELVAYSCHAHGAHERRAARIDAARRVER